MKKQSNKTKIKLNIKMLWGKFYIKLKPFLTPNFGISFGIAWLLTNGWAYIFLGIGINLNIPWMRNIGIAYLALLWMPFTPEKLITIPIALFIHKLIFRKKATLPIQNNSDDDTIKSSGDVNHD